MELEYIPIHLVDVYMVNVGTYLKKLVVGVLVWVVGGLGNNTFHKEILGIQTNGPQSTNYNY